MSVTKSFFGKMPDGREVELYTLKNGELTLQVITLGATLQALYAPDKFGRVNDITVGFDSLYGHLNFTDYQGKTVGRYANRLAGGKMTIDGEEVQLVKNEREKTCLHSDGEFSSAVWSAEIVGENSVTLTHTSADGTSGFKGNLTAKVTYTLTDDNRVVIEYYAVCDKATAINFTNHTYFNLNGSAESTVLSHVLQLNSDSFTPTDTDSIPTDEIRPAEGTAFDFRTPHEIGERINFPDEQLVQCLGYDHNFCLNHVEGEADATLFEPVSGRKLELYTDLPGVQIYTGNFLDGSILGKGGMPLVKNAGVCLETQYYPDTPNHPEFPQCTFAAGEEYRSVTQFKISVVK